MKKVLIVMAVLAMVAPAMAGNLPIGDAIPWNAPWGSSATVTDLGDNVVQLDLTTGSAGIFWRLPAYDSEPVSVTGTWSGDVSAPGWAEVMFFTSTEGLSDGDVASMIDVGNAPLIAAKKDGWGLNTPPTVWGPEAIELSPHPAPGGNFELHATCAEVVIGLKIGANPGTVSATYDLTYIPEPASLMLLLGGLPLLLRRRR